MKDKERILIVDDEPINLEFFDVMLSKLGFEVSKAEDGEAGLAMVRDFKPDLIIISAGFDAHHRDPLAEINLVEDDFDWATGKLMDAAGRHCDNRLVSLLEGGYDLKGLASSTAAHVMRLMRG